MLCNDFAYDKTMKAAECKSDFELTKSTPYLALKGELWGIYCEDLGENGLHYNGTVLHLLLWINVISSPVVIEIFIKYSHLTDEVIWTD